MENEENSDFLGIDDVEPFIRSVYPDAREIKLINHGYHNIVAVLDNELVFRFPRNELSAKRQLFEADLLNNLDSKITVSIPKVIKCSSDPYYLITSFIPGKNLSIEEFRSFNDQEVHNIAHQLANFMSELNDSISVSIVSRLRERSPLNDHKDEDWNVYLERTLLNIKIPSNPELERLAKSQFEKWKQLQDSNTLPEIVIHDDIHIGNLLFKDNLISGVLDFGYAKPGTAAEEMRLLLPISETLLNSTIDQYRKRSGQTVKKEDVMTWSITSYLASFCDRLSHNETSHPSYVRTRQCLKVWLPEYDKLFG